MTTGCSSDTQGGKAWMYFHTRGWAGHANRACGCVALHAIAGELPFSGTNRPSWTLAAWLPLVSLWDWMVSEWSGWNPDGCKTGLDHSQSVRTALKRARQL